MCAASVVKHIKRTIEGSTQPGGLNPFLFLSFHTLFPAAVGLMELVFEMAFGKNANANSWYVEPFGNIMLHNSTAGCFLNFLCPKG